MELSLQQPDTDYTIRRVDAHAVAVGNRTLQHSFVLTPTALIEDWPADSMDAIDQDRIDQLLALEPELVLLGSGQRQQFAPARVQAGLLQRGVGLECMDNAACARTFNLLAAEGRRVAAAFLIS